MATPRILVVSPEAGFGRMLGAALETVASVEVKPTLDALGTGELTASLCVIQFAGDLAKAAAERIPQLVGGCPVLAILPRSNLASIVELMQSSTRFVGALVAEDLDPRQLAAMARRVVADQAFEFDGVLTPGTEVHELAVREDRQKTACLAAIAGDLDRLHVARAYRGPIEQCVDEMVTNALYDAPVDAQGARVFEHVGPRERIGMRTEQTVTVRFASDGTRFVIGVRDAFGSLDRRTVIRYLQKGLYDAQPVERKTGGAGLGLYLMVNAATGVEFHLLPGFATEVVCTFALASPRRGLGHLGVFVQRDPGDLPVAQPAHARRTIASRRRGAGRVLAVAAVIACAAAVVPRLVHRGAATAPASPLPPDAPLVATLELDSQPPGATAAIDGKPAGATPLTVTTLLPGATVQATFALLGYDPATASVQVPALGKTVRLARTLRRSADFVSVHFSSTPPGAEVVETGQPPGIDRTYTPADVFVRTGQEHRFTLIMPKHAPLEIPPFTAVRGTAVLDKGGTLLALPD